MATANLRFYTERVAGEEGTVKCVVGYKTTKHGRWRHAGTLFLNLESACLLELLFENGVKALKGGEFTHYKQPARKPNE